MSLALLSTWRETYYAEMKNSLTVWNNCLDIIRKNVNVQSFKTWFEPIKPVALEKSALTIQVPNKFFYEWLEEHYVSLLKMTIRKELGDKGSLRYQIVLDDKKGKTVSPSLAPKVESNTFSKSKKESMLRE